MGRVTDFSHRTGLSKDCFQSETIPAFYHIALINKEEAIVVDTRTGRFPPWSYH